MTHTRGQMPAEHDTYCHWCGTNPCQHPMSPVERPTRADLTWIVGITIIGWVLIIIGATIIGSGT